MSPDLKTFATLIFVLTYLSKSQLGLAQGSGSASDLGPPIELSPGDFFPGSGSTAPEFQNPVLPSGLAVLGNNPRLDINSLPEGLTVVGDGQLRSDRDTIIFFHGWTSSGNVRRFEEHRRWQAERPGFRGFNVLVYYWHRRSYDTTLPPVKAEGRIWREVGEEAVAAYERLARSLTPNYRGEIRFVGHSLGAQLATYTMWRVRQLRINPQPIRLELLDPFISSARLPSNAPLRNFASQFQNSGLTLSTVMRQMLFEMKSMPPQKGIVAYVTLYDLLAFIFRFGEDVVPVLGSNYFEHEKVFVHNVFENVHVQLMDKRWLSDIIPDSLPFLQGLIKLFERQHNQILDAYMKSIDGRSGLALAKLKNPSGNLQRPFYAGTPTDLIVSRFRTVTKQVEGIFTEDFSDDVFERIRPARCPLQTRGTWQFVCFNF